MNSIDEIVCEPDSKHRDDEVGENFEHIGEMKKNENNYTTYFSEVHNDAF